MSAKRVAPRVKGSSKYGSGCGSWTYSFGKWTADLIRNAAILTRTGSQGDDRARGRLRLLGPFKPLVEASLYW